MAFCVDVEGTLVLLVVIFSVVILPMVGLYAFVMLLADLAMVDLCARVLMLMMR